MTKSSSPPVGHEQILAALEASAAALRALELAASLSSAERNQAPVDGRTHLDHAIKLLRESIREARLADDGAGLAGMTGFVLAVGRRRH